MGVFGAIGANGGVIFEAWLYFGSLLVHCGPNLALPGFFLDPFWTVVAPFWIPKGGQREARDAKRAPKWMPNDAKRSQRSPKDAKREVRDPKRKPKDAKRSQNRRKISPKWTQNLVLNI